MAAVTGLPNTQELVRRYLRYLSDERRYSPATVENYRRDILQFVGFVESAKVENCCKADALNVRDFAGSRRRRGNYERSLQ
ncbi:MAG: hypothetical protein F4Y53_03985, partial [Proteobacteria bacterium]|nr:hypothetical protein [Pseudomonadota bacterium]